MTVHLTKWVPFRIAYKLHSLRQGTLNIGNDAQNKANLLALALANANGGGVATPPQWAKWRAGFGGAFNASNPTNSGSQTSGAGLLINVQAVPGYVPPVGTND